MTLINTADAPCQINTRTAIASHGQLSRQLDARYQQLITSSENYLNLAEGAADRGENQEACWFLRKAQECTAEMDEIRSMWED